MEPLIRALNDPKNQGSPAQIHEIQRQLQALQRETSAWQTSLELLQNNDAIIRFYGALTLTIKINADWKSDRVGKDTAARASLLEALVSSYVRLALLEDENYVIQKLASTLATLYQRLGPEWPSPVRHVLASLMQQQYVPATQLPPMSDMLNAISQYSVRQMASILRFSMTLAEDISSRVPGSTTQQQLALGCGDVLELIGHLLGRYCSSLSTQDALLEKRAGSDTDGNSVMLAQLAFEALPLWTSLLRLQEAHAPKEESQAANRQAVLCTTMALRVLGESDVASTALHALVMIQTLSPRLLAKADPGFPQSLATSPPTQQWVATLVRGDPSPEALAFVDLLEAIMLQVDTTSSDYIHSRRYTEILNLLVTLLKCEGAAGVEDEVCQRILETIGTLVEGHTDWEGELEEEKFLEQFVGQVCEACLEKAKLPAEEMDFATRTWDKDDRSKFQDFRYDVQDFLQSSFGVIGPGLLEAITGATTSAASWRDFEGSLYCLLAFADTLSLEPEVYNHLVASALDGPYFREVLHAQNVPDMARKTCIKFISETTSYFRRHPSLMQILNFLFSSLHLPSSAAIASRAIFTLCDSQRSALTEALPGFLASLDTVSDLRGMERHRIYGAVAAVVQSIKQDSEKVKPMLDILDLLAKDVQQSNGMTADDDNFVEHNTDQLQTLAAIGRGLRAYDETLLPLPDEPIQIEDNTPADPNFWLTGPGAVVQERTLQIYLRIVERVGSRASSEFVEASCDFVRSGFTEAHPSPFKFSSQTSVDLVSRNISVMSPNIDVVMGSAASLLAAASREEFRPQFPRLLQPALGGMQQLLNSAARVQDIRNSSYPSATLDFMSRTFPRWGSELLELSEAQDALAICFELALLVIAEPDTLPRRAAAHFFGAFVELSKPGKLPQEGRAYQTLTTVSERYQPRVLGSMLRLIGGECARSELDVLAEQIRRYAQSQPMMLKSIGREAMKDESQVLSEKALHATTREQRERFISQIDALRGARKTNEIVKDFWVSCRGVDFGYIA